MESNWKLREFPVSKEDLESMKNSLERLNICSDTYAVMPSNTALVHRKLHHCIVCDVILNSCTQTRDHCNGRKHLSRLKLSGKETSFGPKGESDQTSSPINSSGIVSLKSNDLSLKDVNSRNTDSSEEVSPTCPPSQNAYQKRPQTATSTPKTTLGALVESNHKEVPNHLGRENGRRTVLQELTDTFADSLNNEIINNDMGPAASKKPPKKMVVARCSICNLEFSGLVVLQSHLSGAKHAKKVKSLEILRELESSNHCIIKSDTSKFLKCEVCDAVVNSSQQLQMHLRGVNVDGGGDGPGVGCFPSMPCNNVNEQGDGHMKQQGFKEGFKYMCAACKVYLNSEIQLQQHMNSKKHKEGITKGRKGTTKAYQYDKENERGMNVTPFYQKKIPKQQGISYWFSQQQKLHRLNLVHTTPLRYMYRGNSTSLVSQRTLPSTLQDYYTHHRYVI